MCHPDSTQKLALGEWNQIRYQGFVDRLKLTGGRILKNVDCTIKDRQKVFYYLTFTVTVCLKMVFPCGNVPNMIVEDRNVRTMYHKGYLLFAYPVMSKL